MHKQLKNGKRKQFIGTFSFPNKIVKQLQAYFFQGGKWYRLKPVKGV